MTLKVTTFNYVTKEVNSMRGRSANIQELTGEEELTYIRKLGQTISDLND